jgi:hypothetical protein
MKPERPARSSRRIAACSVQFTVSGEPAGMGYCPLEITIRSLLKWLPNKWNSLACIRGLHRQQESEREPASSLSCSEAMCVIGSTQSLPSTIALASPVLLRKKKNLTGRPPAGRARSLRRGRRSGADGRSNLQSFSAGGRLGIRKQWRAPIFPRSTPCLPVVPRKAISILSKNPKKTRVAGPAALKRPVYASPSIH